MQGFPICTVVILLLCSAAIVGNIKSEPFPFLVDSLLHGFMDFVLSDENMSASRETWVRGPASNDLLRFELLEDAELVSRSTILSSSSLPWPLLQVSFDAPPLL
jgi:hypothetical protein